LAGSVHRLPDRRQGHVAARLGRMQRPRHHQDAPLAGLTPRRRAGEASQRDLRRRG
jgi:hypothetical protein